MSHWSAPFVGLPWLLRGRTLAGIDCLGLIRLPLAEVGAELPSYAEHYTCLKEREEIAALLADRAASHPWRPVEDGREREYDMVMFRVGALESHVGLVAVRGRMLHIVRGETSKISNYRDGHWSPRLIGFYRHEALAAGHD